MDDAKKNKIEENIDRMAREWYLSKLSNENEGKTLKLRNAIWEETESGGEREQLYPLLYSNVCKENDYGKR